jgi:hypothetical protein
MADSENTRIATETTRRTMLAGLAAAPVAGLPAIAGAAVACNDRHPQAPRDFCGSLPIICLTLTSPT